MLSVIRYTLLTDGTSDAVLEHHLTWLLQQHTQSALRPQWADLSRYPHPPNELAKWIRVAVDLYPCELLFVHRDAERVAHAERVAEIREALGHSPALAVCGASAHARGMAAL